MTTDLDFAHKAHLKPIKDIAKKLKIPNEYIQNYGNYKAKIDISLLDKLKDKKDGRLVLVTAITPTPAGEGKTTTTVGIGQAFARLGKKAIICLREPSLGPVFGMKGGAAGGGCSQVLPMEDINLHFTGDLHAITAANNLLATLIDNHIYHGNKLKIKEVTWRRCLDMNDRSLRNITIQIKKMPYERKFDITAASEVMAILCLATSVTDLKRRLGNVVIGYDNRNQPILATQLKAEGAMTLVLKDAINPNLVQTVENTPAFIHGGPFANIAHGCNSLLATKLALKLAEIVVTEAGFGSDLGAEKFLDIKCRTGQLKPCAVVIVATVRALKMHGNAPIDKLFKKDVSSLKKGLDNLEKHIENINKFRIPVMVAINKFSFDTKEEITEIEKRCQGLGVEVVLSEVFNKCGPGGVEVDKKILQLLKQNDCGVDYLYKLTDSIKTKIEKIASNMYGAKGVKYTKEANLAIKKIEKTHPNLAVCIAKTHKSLSDNPNLIGRPTNFDITVTDAKVSAGAGFVVIYCGKVMTLPGLNKTPASEGMDLSEKGIKGLF